MLPPNSIVVGFFYGLALSGQLYQSDAKLAVCQSFQRGMKDLILLHSQDHF